MTDSGALPYNLTQTGDAIQPLPKPEHRTVGTWLFHDLSAKTLIIAVIGMSAWYYGTQGKISVGEERDRSTNARIDDQAGKLGAQIEANAKRLDTQLSAIQSVRETTLRRDTYDRDQQHLENSLSQISGRIDTTEKVLIEHTYRR